MPQAELGRLVLAVMCWGLLRVELSGGSSMYRAGLGYVRETLVVYLTSWYGHLPGGRAPSRMSRGRRHQEGDQESVTMQREAGTLKPASTLSHPASSWVFSCRWGTASGGPGRGQERQGQRLGPLCPPCAALGLVVVWLPRVQGPSAWPPRTVFPGACAPLCK